MCPKQVLLLYFRLFARKSQLTEGNRFSWLFCERLFCFSPAEKLNIDRARLDQAAAEEQKNQKIKRDR